MNQFFTLTTESILLLELSYQHFAHTQSFIHFLTVCDFILTPLKPFDHLVLIKSTTVSLSHSEFDHCVFFSYFIHKPSQTSLVPYDWV